jgi:secreted trypsin-like serine protease
MILLVAGMLVLTGSAQAMSGGRPTRPGEAPWVATLAVKGDEPLLRRAGCGGALITPTRVLTAAHCLDGADRDQFEVHVDAWMLSGDPGVVRDIRTVAVLPGYEILPSPVDPENLNWASAKHDLAVVVLDRPVPIEPVRIAWARPRPGTPVALYSHGTTGQPGEWRDDVLNRGDLTVLDDRACHDATPAVVDRGSVACASGAAAACYLDSGSPVVADDRLVGVFSFAGETAGKECQPFPMYVADAPAFRRWAYGPLRDH